MIGYTPFLFRRHNPALFFGPRHDAVNGPVEFVHSDGVLAVAGGEEGRLIDHIGQIRPYHARRTRRDALCIDICSQTAFRRIDSEDAPTPPGIRPANHYLAIKTAGAEQRLVQDLRTVGSAEDNHALAWIKAIHLG